MYLVSRSEPNSYLEPNSESESVSESESESVSDDKIKKIIGKILTQDLEKYMNDTKYYSEQGDYFVFKLATMRQDFELIKNIMDDTRSQEMMEKNWAFKWCLSYDCHKRAHHVIETGFDYDYNYDNYGNNGNHNDQSSPAINHAKKCEDTALFLLRHNTTNVAIDNNYPIIWASKLGYDKVVVQLLKNPIVDRLFKIIYQLLYRLKKILIKLFINYCKMLGLILLLIIILFLIMQLYMDILIWSNGYYVTRV